MVMTQEEGQKKHINWNKLYLSDYYQKVGNAFVCQLCDKKNPFRTGSRKEIRRHIMEVHKSQIRNK